MAEGRLQVALGAARSRVERPRGASEPGDGPGRFAAPHGVHVTHDERVLVADRENDRVQSFAVNGAHGIAGDVGGREVGRCDDGARRGLGPRNDRGRQSPDWRR